MIKAGNSWEDITADFSRDICRNIVCLQGMLYCTDVMVLFLLGNIPSWCYCVKLHTLLVASKYSVYRIKILSQSEELDYEVIYFAFGAITFINGCLFLPKMVPKRMEKKNSILYILNAVLYVWLH